MAKKRKSNRKSIVLLLVFGVIVITLIANVVRSPWLHFRKENIEIEEQTIIVSSSRLEKVLHISELSTYQVTFNGVATVRDDADKVLYHVAYDATISIGFDMERIRVGMNTNEENNPKIVVTLPEIEIKDVNVDPGSLDYIFYQKNANTEKVFATAYPACREDAENECKANDMLFDLARQNTENVIKALIQPLMEQYEDYSLEIVYEGGYAYE